MSGGGGLSERGGEAEDRRGKSEPAAIQTSWRRTLSRYFIIKPFFSSEFNKTPLGFNPIWERAACAARVSGPANVVRCCEERHAGPIQE